MTEHFEAVSRALATGTPRRALFGILGASALAGPATLLLVDDADAKKKKKKNKNRCAKLGESCAKKPCCGGSVASLCVDLFQICVRV